MTASPAPVTTEMLSSDRRTTSRREAASPRQHVRLLDKSTPIPSAHRSPSMGVSQEAWYQHIQRLLEESSALSGGKLPARLAATSPIARRGPFSPALRHREIRSAATDPIRQHRSTSTAPVQGQQRATSPVPSHSAGPSSAPPVREEKPLPAQRELPAMSDVRTRLAEMDQKLSSHLQQLRQWSTPSTEMAMNKRLEEALKAKEQFYKQQFAALKSPSSARPPQDSTIHVPALAYFHAAEPAYPSALHRPMWAVPPAISTEGPSWRSPAQSAHPFTTYPAEHALASPRFTSPPIPADLLVTDLERSEDEIRDNIKRLQDQINAQKDALAERKRSKEYTKILKEEAKLQKLEANKLAADLSDQEEEAAPPLNKAPLQALLPTKRASPDVVLPVPQQEVASVPETEMKDHPLSQRETPSPPPKVSQHTALPLREEDTASVISSIVEELPVEKEESVISSIAEEWASHKASSHSEIEEALPSDVDTSPLSHLEESVAASEPEEHLASFEPPENVAASEQDKTLEQKSAVASEHTASFSQEEEENVASERAASFVQEEEHDTSLAQEESVPQKELYEPFEESDQEIHEEAIFTDGASSVAYSDHMPASEKADTEPEAIDAPLDQEGGAVEERNVEALSEREAESEVMEEQPIPSVAESEPEEEAASLVSHDSMVDPAMAVADLQEAYQAVHQPSERVESVTPTDSFVSETVTVTSDAHAPPQLVERFIQSELALNESLSRDQSHDSLVLSESDAADVMEVMEADIAKQFHKLTADDPDTDAALAAFYRSFDFAQSTASNSVASGSPTRSLSPVHPAPAVASAPREEEAASHPPDREVVQDDDLDEMPKDRWSSFEDEESDVTVTADLERSTGFSEGEGDRFSDHEEPDETDLFALLRHLENRARRPPIEPAPLLDAFDQPILTPLDMADELTRQKKAMPHRHLTDLMADLQARKDAAVAEAEEATKQRDASAIEHILAGVPKSIRHLWETAYRPSEGKEEHGEARPVTLVTEEALAETIQRLTSSLPTLLHSAPYFAAEKSDMVDVLNHISAQLLPAGTDAPAALRHLHAPSRIYGWRMTMPRAQFTRALRQKAAAVLIKPAVRPPPAEEKESVPLPPPSHHHDALVDSIIRDEVLAQSMLFLLPHPTDVAHCDQEVRRALSQMEQQSLDDDYSDVSFVTREETIDLSDPYRSPDLTESVLIQAMQA